MSELSISELRRLDLTLLLVFLGLVRHRKARHVADELGLTQSAISQALKRLREIFGDDLFLRRPYGMEPTAVALALEQPIAAAVETLRGAIGKTRAFDPSIAGGVVRIAALDAEQAVLLPLLMARLRIRAPGLTLSVLALGRGAAMEALTEGSADLAVGYVWQQPEAVLSERLYDEDFQVAGPSDLIPDAPRITLDEFCSAKHVLISPGGDLRGIVDDQLGTMGRSRHVILGLPAFLPALTAAATARALVTLPSRVARAFAAGFGLVTADPPVPVRSFPISVFWHRRNDNDPRTVWVRAQLADLKQPKPAGLR